MLYDTEVTRIVANHIGRSFFGFGVAPNLYPSAYVFVSGKITLRVMREIIVPGQVHCRVEVRDQGVGYFNFDMKTLEMSRLWKDD